VKYISRPQLITAAQEEIRSILRLVIVVHLSEDIIPQMLSVAQEQLKVRQPLVVEARVVRL
jgi:hypothetical protein